MTLSKLHLAVVGVLIALPAQAQTETGVTAQVGTGYAPAAPAPVETRVPPPGGHLGIAIPIVTAAADSGVIFDDFFDLGLAPGITIPLNLCWSFDFEFIAYDHFKSRRGPTTFVLDPGVVFDWGPLSTGLRAAVAVGGPSANNFGLIPIINKGFRIYDRLRWFIELDLPLFFSDAHTNRVTFTPQLQTGVAF